ncbi:rCG49980 [Rattus norvegicus]|uniref:RCG49980 n=1 Tax=Rattus norvegicus TaxID=10116 RepID=A6JV50_RAT|nr:rCG49980 [Rattus norvegicus]
MQEPKINQDGVQCWKINQCLNKIPPCLRHWEQAGVVVQAFSTGH